MTFSKGRKGNGFYVESYKYVLSNMLKNNVYIEHAALNRTSPRNLSPQSSVNHSERKPKECKSWNGWRISKTKTLQQYDKSTYDI